MNMYNIPWKCVEISLLKAPGGHDMQVFLAWIAQGLDFKATESATLTCDAGAWHLPQDGGFPARHGGTPNSWMVFVRGNPNRKWMMTGGSPISGNLYMTKYHDGYSMIRR